MTAAVCNTVREDKKTQAVTATPQYTQTELIMLVEDAASGNFEAFGELYSLYLDRIYRYIFYQVNDRMTAEDITEEVFLKAWKAIGTCKGKERTFLSWLYRIAHNHLINTLRSMTRFVSIEKENVVELADPKQGMEANLEYQDLLETIACLPQNQKQVIILKFIEGLDNREIGKIMKKNEGAIRVLQMRALSRIKERFN